MHLFLAHSQFFKISLKPIANEDSFVQLKILLKGDGPVAVPTSLTEWPQILTTAATMHPAATSASTTIADNTIVQSSYVPFDHGRIVNGFNNHVWELAVLQFFDRVAPQMTYMRLQPKGMPK